jgi:hypothetical protein
MIKVPEPHERAAANRELAKRARQIAQALPQNVNATRLIRYAEELEQRAARAENASAD